MEIQEFGSYVPTPAPPLEVTRAQARIAMSRAGISVEMVDAVIDAMPDGQAKTEMRLWWTDSNAFQRNHPAVIALAPALGLSAGQVDDLFAVARGL